MSKHEKIKANYLADKNKIEQFQEVYDNKIILENNPLLKLCKICTLFFALKLLKLKIKVKYFFYEIKIRRINKKTLTLSNDALILKLLAKVLDIIIILVVGAILLFPFYWMIVTSFKSYAEVNPAINQTPWPQNWSLEAYTELFKWLNTQVSHGEVGMTRFFINSIVVSVCSTLLQLFVSLLGGFAIYNWKTKINPLFLIIMFSVMMIPGEALLVGRFVIVDRIGWQNNILALIVPFIGNVFTIYLVSNAFSGLGKDLKWASKIDGLSNFKYFIKIAIPAITSTLITSFIIGLIGAWNSTLWPVTIMDQDGVWTTIPIILYQLISLTGVELGGSAPMDPINVKMAGCVICILPMIIMFVLFNKPIINGLTRRNNGGNKG